MEATLTRWNHLCNQLSIGVSEKEYQHIITAYSEPHRAYHTLQHLSECLSQLDWMLHNETIISSALNPAQLEFALWYHDIIYQTHRSNNELKSAQSAANFLGQQQADKEVAKQIYSLIIATCHNQETIDEAPIDNNQYLIIDIDLAILGANAKQFDEYEQQIRNEYQRVPLTLYKLKRKQVLKSFLKKPRIYHSPLFYEAYESQARKNMLHAIKSL